MTGLSQLRLLFEVLPILFGNPKLLFALLGTFEEPLVGQNFFKLLPAIKPLDEISKINPDVMVDIVERVPALLRANESVVDVLPAVAAELPAILQEHPDFADDVGQLLDIVSAEIAGNDAFVAFLPELTGYLGDLLTAVPNIVDFLDDILSPDNDFDKILPDLLPVLLDPANGLQDQLPDVLVTLTDPSLDLLNILPDILTPELVALLPALLPLLDPDLGLAELLVPLLDPEVGLVPLLPQLLDPATNFLEALPLLADPEFGVAGFLPDVLAPDSGLIEVLPILLDPANGLTDVLPSLLDPEGELFPLLPILLDPASGFVDFLPTLLDPETGLQPLVPDLLELLPELLDPDLGIVDNLDAWLPLLIDILTVNFAEELAAAPDLPTASADTFQIVETDVADIDIDEPLDMEPTDETGSVPATVEVMPTQLEDLLVPPQEDHFAFS